MRSLSMAPQARRDGPVVVRPGPDREIDPVKVLRVGQLPGAPDSVGGVAAFSIGLGDDVFGAAAFPLVEHLGEQRGTAVEVAVEPALRHAEFGGESLDADGVGPSSREGVEARLYPAGSCRAGDGGNLATSIDRVEYVRYRIDELYGAV